ncbi:MAG TPA: zinc ABC transporter substrate-binding protein [Acidimicrobiales bacterium]|nr:zinc ABC transporter substrate-binding protein [Acidimicrobiales bacterium]
MVVDKVRAGIGRRRRRPAAVAALAAAALAAAGAGCGPAAPAAASRSGSTIAVVAAENEYGNVAAQIGGRLVSVVSVERNPNADPHSYEVSPAVASEVSNADLVIENGLGYDSFMGRLEAADPSRRRRVIDVQRLLGLPPTTGNPHLWYSPATMPAVAAAIASDLGLMAPSHRAYFRAHLERFLASLRPWEAAIAAFRTGHPGVTAATTEPVADDLLAAMGIRNLTPFSFQAAIMNGADPSPQGVGFEDSLLSHHRVDLFAYNQQVVDAVTASVRATAVRAGVPVVAVYETMPTPGYDYQTWMMAETRAIEKAVVARASTRRL